MTNTLNIKRGSTEAETAFNLFHALAVERAKALIAGDGDRAEELQEAVVNISFDQNVEVLPAAIFIEPHFERFAKLTQAAYDSFLQFVVEDKTPITRTELYGRALSGQTRF